MQEMVKLLDEIVQQTKFEARHQGVFSLDKLRTQSRRDKMHGGLTAASAKANVPEDSLETLVHELRPLLSRYIEPESDRIGYGIVDLMGGAPRPTIADFARILVRAAATLGPNRAVQLVFGWIEGKPLHYQVKILLSGVSIDQPSLELEEGICITRLPKSTSDLPAYVPTFDVHFHGSMSFLGGAVLSIDCEVGPALYAPPKSGKLWSNTQHTWAQGKIPPYAIDTFCEALSLACNHCVRRKYSWPDFGDLQEFNLGIGRGVSPSNVPDGGPRIDLSQEHLEQALDIQSKRDSSQEKQGLGMMISRWANSKRPESSLPDQFIELRIALEALYLKDRSGEKGFRLATYGAWHVGTNFKERMKHHKTLLKMYKIASAAVHASELKDKDKKENRRLLTASQDLCRAGILKIINERREFDWNEMILGAGID